MVYAVMAFSGIWLSISSSMIAAIAIARAGYRGGMAGRTTVIPGLTNKLLSQTRCRMKISTLPILVAVVFGAFWFMVSRLNRRGSIDFAGRNALAVLLTMLLCWGMFVGYQADRGVFSADRLVGWQAGYWLPSVPTAICLILVSLVESLRNALRRLVDDTPAHWLTAIHIMRILAIGTLIKAYLGLFPAKFAWFVGGPDLLFGLSAIVVSLLARRNRLSDRALMLWHLTGALVILIPVIGLMPLFMREELITGLFAFPMVLAPALVVPSLVMLNLLVAWRLLEKELAKRPA
jgi:hypothetical protein